MICPECESKIGQKNYDAAFGWYECPSCEGCFTGDEIMEAEIATHSRKVDAGTGSNRRTAVTANGHDKGSAKKVVAKAKKKQQEIDADAEALAAYEKKTTEVVVVADKKTKHRDEISVAQVVQIMADEIDAVYEEMGQHITRLNAEDKALTLWRNLTVHDGITAREKPVEVVLCKEHS